MSNDVCLCEDTKSAVYFVCRERGSGSIGQGLEPQRMRQTLVIIDTKHSAVCIYLIVIHISLMF